MAERPIAPRGPLEPDGPDSPGEPPAGTSDPPVPPIGRRAAAHADHDLLLVAAYAAGDVEDAALTAAVELVAGCPECAALATDLRSLAAATRVLPPARRPRDFTISPADAERLRPRALRRLLAALAAPRSIGRPLAAGLTTLGLAGLLVASLPGIVPLGSSGAAPEAVTGGQPAASGAPTAIPGQGRTESGGDTQSKDNLSAAPAAASVAPAASFAGPPGDAVAPAASAEPESYPSSPLTAAGDDAPATRDVAADGRPALAVVSLVLLAAGVGLFALRRRAARGT